MHSVNSVLKLSSRADLWFEQYLCVELEKVKGWLSDVVMNATAAKEYVAKIEMII